MRSQTLAAAALSAALLLPTAHAAAHSSPDPERADRGTTVKPRSVLDPSGSRTTPGR